MPCWCCWPRDQTSVMNSLHSIIMAFEKALRYLIHLCNSNFNPPWWLNPLWNLSNAMFQRSSWTLTNWLDNPTPGGLRPEWERPMIRCLAWTISIGECTEAFDSAHVLKTIKPHSHVTRFGFLCSSLFWLDGMHSNLMQWWLNTF